MIYNTEKTPGHGAKVNGKAEAGDKTCPQNGEAAGQNVPQPETADVLADQFKVSPKTIKRDAAFALHLDKIADVLGKDARDKVLEPDAFAIEEHLHRDE